MKLKLLASLLLTTCVSTMFALPMDAAKKQLKVGSDTTYPPFEYQDTKSGKYVGFSMDLINAIADKLNMEAVIVSTSWEGILPGLINGNYDCVISSMTITEERSKQVAFSDSYFTANQAIVVKKENKDIKKASDLKDKKVSVQINTTGDMEVTDNIKGAKVERFPTTPDALLALMNGNDDASVVDEPLARYFMKQYPVLKIANNDFAKEEYGIAVKKENTSLLKNINKALKELKANGTYKKITDKYFGK